jgi:hypothetical protein
MKQVRNILYIVCCLVLLTACSSNDEDGIMSLSDDGLTSGDWIGDDIPIALVSVSDLPEWMHSVVDRMEERERIIANYKIFQGKWESETVYYFNNNTSSCIASLFYHHDGTPFGDVEWGRKGLSTADFSDWRCIWSAAPLKKGITGILHYDPTENRDSYVDCSQERYYIWGGMNDSDLQKYDGKHVIMSGFLWGDITKFIVNLPSGVYPSGVACYGIEATYIRGD